MLVNERLLSLLQLIDQALIVSCVSVGGLYLSFQLVQVFLDPVFGNCCAAANFACLYFPQVYVVFVCPMHMHMHWTGYKIT